ncbi:olfactory receptor 13C7-like [Lepus europaeus]|uniref:olfactory receptor 13C7-like n=1 Tax=Lepus europaeus TaxID=9983 RepID=UPI002B4A90EF|nr:olfactory receptor 13C7-like [Lepus europaeus]
MGAANQSMVTEFVLLGLSAHPTLEKTFFVLILLMYLGILLGNGVLLLVTALDAHLHTPMHFFLGHLSLLDGCYTTSSVPLILDSFLTPRKTISFSGCAVQMFLSFAMGATECVLLGMMAFDRYVAICRPLRYPVVMSEAAYVPMAADSWVAGGANSLVQVSLAVQLPFCGDNIINHVTCEILAVLKLACADISINVISMVVANVIFLGVPVLFIFVSYIFILTTILRIPSAKGRKKAFSTCSAHLTVVVVFYGAILFMDGKPKSKDPLGADKQDLADKLISLFYGLLTPMLNPIIYSLRNKDVKAAARSLVAQKCCPFDGGSHLIITKLSEGKLSLELSSSPCGLGTKSIGITWELTQHTESWVPLQIYCTGIFL